jgi:O-antigen/teichoic acid export membrane protein
LLPALRISFSLFNRDIIKELFNLATSLFLVQVTMVIIYPTDKLIIAAFLPVGAIVFYEAAFKIYSLVLEVPHMLASAVTPAASELNALDDAEGLRNLFVRGTKYSTAFFLAICIPTLFLSKEILTYWMGPDFTASHLLAVVFILHLFFNYNHLFAYHVLVGMNRLGRPALAYYIGSAVLNLILSIILVRRIGLMGAVLGTVIPYAVLEPVFIRYNLVTFKMPLAGYVKQILLTTYPSALAIALLFYVVKPYLLPQSLLGVAALASAGALGYMALFSVFGLQAWERNSLMEAFAGLGRQLRYSLGKARILR